MPLDAISPIMLKAIVAIEDSRFYDHGALDLKGTLRAMIRNQTEGEVQQGGSSITQQYVKLSLVEKAKTAAERAAGHRGHLPAQADRAAVRDRGRERAAPRTRSSSGT